MRWRLSTPPVRIECFDISHIQGLETVASMVVFERGVPKKDDYRKFKIKTVQGIDDFASMAEVVGRRYRRLHAEEKPLPNLILIDGGKGQLSAAWGALHALMGSAYKNLGIAALAKREEDLFLPDRSEPVLLPKDSPALAARPACPRRSPPLRHYVPSPTPRQTSVLPK